MMDKMSGDHRRTRRSFLQTAGLAAGAFALPLRVQSVVRQLKRKMRLGIIADLHHDVIPDGPARLESFLGAMHSDPPDAIIQLGDFAVPSQANSRLIDRFNTAHPRTLHVVGNHDTDGGYTTQQLLDGWGLKRTFDSYDVCGLRIIVLDGNDRPANHAGGYPSFVGPAQLEWLTGEVQRHQGPMLILSHQPLAGPWAIDNAEQIQDVLNTASDRVVLAINGHSHIDHVVRAGDIHFLHLNSASYVVVGSDFAHESYPREVHAAYPKLASFCPYRDALFTTLTIDPENGQVAIEGRSTTWVGPSPAELGRDKHPDLIHGEHIAPRIRERQLERISRDA